MRSFTKTHQCAGLMIVLTASILAAGPSQIYAQSLSQAGAAKNDKPKRETRYFDELREIPVMPGLSAEEDAASVFDKPGGRIVQVRATGRNVSIESVRTFYARTLPALGWQPRSADSYVRGGEKLSLAFDREGRKLILDISLRPRKMVPDNG